MIDYWARFATTGNPNRPGLPWWRTVDPAATTPYVQGLDVRRIGPVDRAALHGFAFWDALAAQR